MERYPLFLKLRSIATQASRHEARRSVGRSDPHGALPMQVRIMVLALALTAFGCVHRESNVVKPVLPTRLAVGHGVSFDPPPGWWLVRLIANPVLMVTENGIDIDALEFRTGIAPGTPLFVLPENPAPDSTQNPMENRSATKTKIADPEIAGTIFRADMTARDVMEAVAADLSRRGVSRVATTDLRPVPFGADTGFRFAYSYVDERGLRMRGLAIAALREGKLDLLMFHAPEQYVFDHARVAVERTFESIRTQPPDAP
jgi:hypothetical protein